MPIRKEGGCLRASQHGPRRWVPAFAGTALKPLAGLYRPLEIRVATNSADESSLRTQGPITTDADKERRRLPACFPTRAAAMGPCVRRDGAKTIGWSLPPP